MGTESMRAYCKVNDRLITTGLPDAVGLRAAAAEGFQAVIDLLPGEPGFSLPGEERLVRELGMTYVSVPVAWEAPTRADFEAFVQVMDRYAGQKVLVHCYANLRATAFVSLYARKRWGWTLAQAEALRQPLWAGMDYPVWEDFLREMNAEI